MGQINESAIETFAIKLFQRLGYEYIHGPDIAPDSESNAERTRYEEVLLLSRVQSAIQRINPLLPAVAKQDALKAVQQIQSPDLLANNETFHRLLTEGVNVNYQQDGDDRGDLAWLIDFNNAENNEFLIIFIKS